MGDAEEVCRVYGGLGGRTGSAKAEQRVFKALEKATKKQTTLLILTRYLMGILMQA